MPHQRIPDQHPQGRFSEEEIDRTVLGFMLYGQTWPWTVDEIARELGDDGNAEDAIRRLTRTGLLHHFGAVVFPTRTARRATQLHLGTV
jgi:hypothetical protein